METALPGPHGPPAPRPGPTPPEFRLARAGDSDQRCQRDAAPPRVSLNTKTITKNNVG